LSALIRSSQKTDDTELAAGISTGALALGLDLPAATVETLVAYVRLIERWNGTYNLTAIRDPRDMVTQHIVDCLAATAALLRRRDIPTDARILDVGSGAGLPGLVFAIAAPRTEITCVDSVGKKAAFVTHAVSALGIPNVAVHHGRVQAMTGRRFDVIASRAFASLQDFISNTMHLLGANGVWMALKGKDPSDELEHLQNVAFHVERLQVPGLTAQRCVVWLNPTGASARL
jgi:16S rRNA (guanine527-N7)-methyltransferase